MRLLMNAAVPIVIDAWKKAQAASPTSAKGMYGVPDW
jgi:hypothetical protein